MRVRTKGIVLWIAQRASQTALESSAVLMVVTVCVGCAVPGLPAWSLRFVIASQTVLAKYAGTTVAGTYVARVPADSLANPANACEVLLP